MVVEKHEAIGTRIFFFNGSIIVMDTVARGVASCNDRGLVGTGISTASSYGEQPPPGTPGARPIFGSYEGMGYLVNNNESEAMRIDGVVIGSSEA